MVGSSKTGLNKQRFEVDNSLRRDTDDDSRSSSDNCDFSDEHDLVPVAPAPAAAGKPYKRKKYNRHTTYQIQELESYFKKCPHPDEKQRIELGKKLGLDSKQIKFWFQNRRTQMKTQLERHENALLKQEFDKLRVENITMKEYIQRPMCKECGRDALALSMDEHQVRLENARLKQELIRVCGIAESLLGKPVSDIVGSLFQPQQGLSVMANPEPAAGLSSVGSNSLGGSKLDELADITPPSTPAIFNDYEKSMYLQVAMAAMDELIVLAQNEPPYWMRSLDGGMETFNHEEYVNKFNPYGVNFPGFKYEATRDSGSVIINSLELVKTLMHPGRWADMFPCMVGKASIISVLCNGIGGTHDGELILFDAEFLFPSPFVPMRHLRFLRYCKKYAEGAWAVVDISIDPLREGYADVTRRSRRLPSGFCILQDVPNSFSLVTCVEHAEYDERAIHSLFRPLVQSGYGFGAHRWLATLQRQCEYAAYLPTSGITPLESSIGVTSDGKKSILKLSRRVVDSFCAGICGSSEAKWKGLNLGDTTPNLQVMTRVNIDEPGEVLGMVLSFSTALWVPVPRHHVFDFLRNGQLRGHWDILADDGPMEETVRITKTTNSANSVAVLCPPAHENREANMVVVQETWADKTSSAVVYSAVDIASMTRVMEGGDPGLVKLLPSGMVITDAFMEPVDGFSSNKGSCSLLTLGFQILMNTSPTPCSLTLNSVETVKELMERTIHKIKVALRCE